MLNTILNKISDKFSSLKKLIQTLPPIHIDGIKFGIIAALFFLLLSTLWEGFALVGLLVLGAILAFFRNPARVAPKAPAAILAPADGLICAIEKVPPIPELKTSETRATRITIFLSVFDVHINRSAITGKVTATERHGGGYLNAADPGAQDNARNHIVIERSDGVHVGIAQIVGFIARRIVCTIAPTAQVQAAQEIGLIRFGSRVDVYLPPRSRLNVLVGQRAIGGETVLATCPIKRKKAS
ncbi:MAG: phosphatidylserine decarboxylase [Pseudomonadota bacterium]